LLPRAQKAAYATLLVKNDNVRASSEFSIISATDLTSKAKESWPLAWREAMVGNRMLLMQEPELLPPDEPK